MVIFRIEVYQPPTSYKLELVRKHHFPIGEALIIDWGGRVDA